MKKVKFYIIRQDFWDQRSVAEQGVGMLGIPKPKYLLYTVEPQHTNYQKCSPTIRLVIFLMPVHCCEAVRGIETKLLLIWWKTRRTAASTRTCVTHRANLSPSRHWRPLGGTRARFPWRSPAGSDPRRCLRREHREAAPPGRAAAAPAAPGAEGRERGREGGRLPGPEGRKDRRTAVPDPLPPASTHPLPPPPLRPLGAGGAEGQRRAGPGPARGGRRRLWLCPRWAAPPPALSSPAPGRRSRPSWALPGLGAVGAAWCCRALPEPCHPCRAGVKFLLRHGRWWLCSVKRLPRPALQQLPLWQLSISPCCFSHSPSPYHAPSPLASQDDIMPHSYGPPHLFSPRKPVFFPQKINELGYHHLPSIKLLQCIGVSVPHPCPRTLRCRKNAI